MRMGVCATQRAARGADRRRQRAARKEGVCVPRPAACRGGAPGICARVSPGRSSGRRDSGGRDGTVQRTRDRSAALRARLVPTGACARAVLCAPYSIHCAIFNGVKFARNTPCVRGPCTPVTTNSRIPTIPRDGGGRAVTRDAKAGSTRVARQGAGAVARQEGVRCRAVGG